MKAKDFITEAKKIERSKPRNFVAKNMGKASSGAGAHKDKKKAEKQGDVKHKNKFNYKKDDWSQDFEGRMKQGVSEEGGEINIADMQKQLAELENRKDTLRHAVQEARKITTEIKYDDTVMGIVTKIQELADKVGVDATDIKYAIQEVQEKANELESAIYALDDAFTDAYRDADNKAAELEYEIDDYQNQSRRNPE
jgi:hypothetical protein